MVCENCGGMDTEITVQKVRWVEAWPDVLAFGSGLAMAWWFQWQTTDLVWSLWLSSLLVGYAMIVWSIFRPAVFIAAKAWGDRASMGKLTLDWTTGLGAGAFLLGGLFVLAFFTVHFGMFHFVHSIFLNSFFPINDGKGFGNLVLYQEVFTRYWWFVPVAALAERQAFRLAPPSPEEPSDTSVTAEAIAARKARKAKKRIDGAFMGPYKNVIRLHLLIFFFAFAHFVKLDNFLVYALVYAVYFFPWKILKDKEPQAAEAQG